MTEPEEHPERRARTLTDEDIKALADELEARFSNLFYGNLGRGLWGFVWRGLIVVALAFAAAGSYKGH